MSGSDGSALAAENQRLAAQVQAMSGDEHIRREAEPWRDATPEERLAATWRLCELVPWFRSLWPEDVRRRADEPEPLPAETLALLQRLKQVGERAMTATEAAPTEVAARLADRFDEENLPYAFDGALALGAYVRRFAAG